MTTNAGSLRSRSQRAGRLDTRSLRDATARVFDAIQPIDPGRVVYGQYDGYRSEPGVAAGSTVETFAALEVQIQNERWSGVPFQLRTGKALAESARRKPPHRHARLQGARA